VVSGNVSLYNESDGRAIKPTPVVGALGILEDVSRAVAMGFRAAGDLVYLLGAGIEGEALRGDAAALAGSEYLRTVHARVAGRPGIDLDLEARLQRAVVTAAERGLLRSAHDCSHGGLLVSIAESCFPGGLGVDLEVQVSGRLDAALFGEEASRVVVSAPAGAAPALESLLREGGVPFLRLGVAGGDRLRLGSQLDAAVAGLREAYESGLEEALRGTQAPDGV
jgi:phosphoribosylformylglycinamidine synthase